MCTTRSTERSEEALSLRVGGPSTQLKNEKNTLEGPQNTSLSVNSLEAHTSEVKDNMGKEAQTLDRERLENVLMADRSKLEGFV